MLVDMHCHILSDIDDESPDMDAGVSMQQQAGNDAVQSMSPNTANTD